MAGSARGSAEGVGEGAVLGEAEAVVAEGVSSFGVSVLVHPVRATASVKAGRTRLVAQRVTRASPLDTDGGPDRR